jgi:hypothetical protein
LLSLFAKLATSYSLEFHARSVEKEQVKQLCESIASEQDPVRFMELVNELNNLLQQSETRLKPNQPLSQPAREI